MELVFSSLGGKALVGSRGLKLVVVDEERFEEFAGGRVFEGPPLDVGAQV